MRQANIQSFSRQSIGPAGTMFLKQSGNPAGLLSCMASLALAFLLLGLPALAALDSSGELTGYRAPLVAVVALSLQAALWLSGCPKLPDRIALALLLLGLQVIIFAAEALARPWTTEYATWKLLGFAIFGLFPAVLVALNYTAEPRRIQHLLIGLFVMAILPNVLMLPTHPELLDPMHAAEQLYLMGGNPIPVSRGFGTAALLSIFYSTTGGMRRRVLCASTAVAMILAQFVVGERGPILALLIAVLVIPSSMKRRIQLVSLMAALAMIAVISGLQHPNHKFSMEAVQDDGRVNIIEWGLEVFTQQPLIGAGLGSFYLPNGNREYLHNLEGELATETGLIGLAAFAGFLFVLWQCRNQVRTPLTTCTLALTVYWFAAAQVSGDIVSNGMCWVTAMLWACSQFQAAQPVSLGFFGFAPSGAQPSGTQPKITAR